MNGVQISGQSPPSISAAGDEPVWDKPEPGVEEELPVFVKNEALREVDRDHQPAEDRDRRREQENRLPALAFAGFAARPARPLMPRRPDLSPMLPNH